MPSGGLDRRLPLAARGGHPAFAIVADLTGAPPQRLDDLRGRTVERPWPLWQCLACWLLVPGWLLTEGLYDRCAAPRRALPPAPQHRDPRRSRQ